MSASDQMADDGEPGGLRNFAAEHRSILWVGIFVLLLATCIGYIILHAGRGTAPKPPPVITVVTIQPVKPPPPPPPLPQPKMITPPKMVTPTAKPLTAAPPKSAPPKAAPTAAAVGTSIHGNGAPDGFNLNGTPCANALVCGGSGGGDGSPGGSALGYYESQLSSAIGNALRQNPFTRHATAGVEIREWVTANGLFIRAELVSGSGKPTIDDAIINQVLPHVSAGAPPAGTPMPILLKLTGAPPL